VTQQSVTVLVVALLLVGCDLPQPPVPAPSPSPANASIPGNAVQEVPGAASASPLDPLADWQEYAFPEAGFKVRLPCRATLQTPEKPSQSYAALGAPATCKIQVEWDAPERLDQKLQNLIQQQPRWQKEPVQTPVTLAGQRALEVISEAEPGRFKRPPPITVVRYLKTDSAIYAVSIECRPEPTTLPMRTAYFDSFHLTK
jgi:hypothetical protein